MTLQDRLEELEHDYGFSVKEMDGIRNALASIKKDFLIKVIGEDEVVEPRTPHEAWGKPERKARNAHRAELRERLERYIG